jgi:hypothetical protein
MTIKVQSILPGGSMTNEMNDEENSLFGKFRLIGAYNLSSLSFSEMKTLITLWRVTPRCLATLSNFCTIHNGKSTLTLFYSNPGLKAWSRSKYDDKSSPDSNFSSNSVAVIYFFFISS